MFCKLITYAEATKIGTKQCYGVPSKSPFPPLMSSSTKPRSLSQNVQLAQLQRRISLQQQLNESTYNCFYKELENATTFRGSFIVFEKLPLKVENYC